MWRLPLESQDRYLYSVCVWVSGWVDGWLDGWWNLDGGLVSGINAGERGGREMVIGTVHFTYCVPEISAVVLNDNEQEIGSKCGSAGHNVIL